MSQGWTNGLMYAFRAELLICKRCNCLTSGHWRGLTKIAKKRSIKTALRTYNWNNKKKERNLKDRQRVQKYKKKEIEQLKEEEERRKGEARKNDKNQREEEKSFWSPVVGFWQMQANYTRFRANDASWHCTWKHIRFVIAFNMTKLLASTKWADNMTRQ